MSNGKLELNLDGLAQQVLQIAGCAGIQPRLASKSGSPHIEASPGVGHLPDPFP